MDEIKEVSIAIVEISKTLKGGVILKCHYNNDAGGTEVTVSAKQAQKAKLGYSTVKAGDSLKADIFLANDKWYAKNIERVEKAESSQENRAITMPKTEIPEKATSVAAEGASLIGQRGESKSMINTSVGKVPEKAHVWKLYIANLNYKATENDVRGFFKNYAEVLSVNLKRNEVTGELIGYGFINIKTSEEIEVLLSKVNGSTFLEQELVVSRADRR